MNLLTPSVTTSAGTALLLLLLASANIEPAAASISSSEYTVARLLLLACRGEIYIRGNHERSAWNLSMVLLLLPAVIGSARMKMLIDPWSLIHLASGATVVSVSLPASVAGAGVVVVVVVVVVIWTWLKHPWTLLCQCNYMISVLSTEKKIVTGNSNFHLGQEE